MRTRTQPKIAVIGAGLSGLAAARTLVDAGARIAVFEKSRGLGGRLATRRPFGREHPLGLDHGTPIAEADDPEVFAQLAELGAPFAPNGGPVRGVVGTPGMSDLVKPLAAGLSITREVEIAAVARGGEDWLLQDANGGAHGPFDAVLVAVPAPQAARLVGETCPDIAAAEMAPCWTLLLAFDASLGAAVDWLTPQDGPLELVLRDSAKPHRHSEGEAWVAHSRAEWAETHLECAKEDAAERLFVAFKAALDRAPPAPRYIAAHRWRYARASKAVGRAYWLSDDGALGVCGDWRLGPKAGDALRSGRLLGRAMAQALLG